MEGLLRDHYAFAQQLRDLDHENDTRKRLVLLCVLKLLAQKGNIAAPAPAAPAAPIAAPDNTELQRKLHDYELRISVLKLQLSTKEKAHEAQVDELKDLVEDLQGQLQASSVQSKKAAARRPLSPPSSAGTSKSLRLPSRSIFAASPEFSRLLLGKGNSFAGPAITHIASQALLKLSQTRRKTDVFSSTPSAEATPSKNRDEQDAPLDGMALGELTPGKDELLSASEQEETFQSANATFSSDTKKGKRKVRLLSSEATRLLLDVKGQDDDDVDALNYYQDENFKDDHTLPTRPKRVLESADGPPVKKRHVFKI